ncbi:hypothetical protein [Puniceibacterium sediminis]|uniref:SnoaL-like domain-containing protein n=1 Tax=Puniceibacterium sediminis TaxID=1608407 RepID=A0A238XWA5_9RHOB|nr:hypothetical protein [Puniceibacterium sediminis]SNR62723.1 hypothetical protein SAMN06265370_11350 [Puniceibacterium sediminis]
MGDDAKHIYQATLDVLTRAALARDTATFARHLVLPHVIKMLDGKVVYNTEQEVHDGINEYRDKLERIGVQTVERNCSFARFVGDTMVSGYHVTQNVTRDAPLPPAYITKGVFCLIDGRWCMSLSDSAMSGEDWPDVPHRHMQAYAKDDETTRTPQEMRKAVSQKLIDHADYALLHGDFDAWRAFITLPLIFEGDIATEVFATESQLREQYENYRHDFLTYKVTDVVRVVSSTELLAQDEMRVDYRAYILNCGTNVVAPWDGRLILKRDQGLWRISRIIRSSQSLQWRSRMHQPLQPGGASSQQAVPATPAIQKPRIQREERN